MKYQVGCMISKRTVMLTVYTDNYGLHHINQ